jgi:membrane protease YdiL (CAAX protease family)
MPHAPTAHQAGVPPGTPAGRPLPDLTRRGLALETWLVMLAALTPWVASAVVTIDLHLQRLGRLDQFPDIAPGHPVTTLVLSVVDYLPTAAVVPLVLLLLYRTGTTPAGLGLTRARWADLWVAIGLAAASFGLEYLIALPLAPLVRAHSILVNTAAHLHVPPYYLVLGITQAALTAVAEETAVNGYLVTRLEQLNWSPRAALVLSLALRLSYHVYYGLFVIVVVPFGYLVTRSFQKHHKLTRPILAHFLYDTAAFMIAILVR